MTYFGFLTGFVVLPYVLLLAWYLFESRVRQSYSRANPIMMLGYAFLILPSLALLYTTPWDNYLVATGVWWYDPALVSGIILGWVPLEEYLFFVLQPMLGGVLLVLVLGRKIFENERKPLNKGIRRRALAAAGASMVGCTGSFIEQLSSRDVSWIGINLGSPCDHPSARIWGGYPLETQASAGAGDRRLDPVPELGGYHCHPIRGVDD